MNSFILHTHGTLMATDSPCITASVPIHNIKLCFNLKTLKKSSSPSNFSEKLHTPTPRGVDIIQFNAHLENGRKKTSP